ncbi:MAG: type VI secretion system-associated protein TagF [Gammaproteobacteria bacterium]|nr:type VI secretion system-associated protein TagF [Gammaproteobacteria bacterium]
MQRQIRILDSQQTERLFQSGYHGKIPGRGDFVYNGLPRDFIEPWDAWLQGAISNSRNRLMDQWLQTYLTSPIWRYYLAPGLCGKHAWAGVVMPSVDKVGRYFPFTVACSLPADFNPFDLMAEQGKWFVEVEELMLALLDENQPSLAGFDQKIELLNQHFDEQFYMDKNLSGVGSGPLWRLPLSAIDEAAMSCSELSKQMLSVRFSTYSLWWSDGSEQVTPSLLVSAGLPAGESFTAMIDGQWAATAWESWPSPSHKPEVNIDKYLSTDLSVDQLISQLLVADEVGKKLTPLSWKSNAMTHVGRVRNANEDACLELPVRGMWVVADGMGGHAAGELASNMVVDDLSRIESSGTLGEFVDDVKTCLDSVNQKLMEKAHEKAVSVIGCTVVVLVMIGRRAAFLWAGDSRIYLSREGELQQLTQDHSYDPVERLGCGGDVNVSNIVTRAVGAGSELDLEVGYVDLKAGDCFLLCSDGLNKEVTDIEIAESMCGKNVLAATHQLIDLSLERGARDNVTVVTVQISATDENRKV